MTIRKLTLITALALMLAPVAAFADTISVANASFEILPAGFPSATCGGSCAYDEGLPIAGWNTTGSYGQWITGGFDGNPSAIDGNVLAFSDSGAISQTVASAIAGETYTLQVDVLHRTDDPIGAMVQIEIGGVVVGTAPIVDNGPGTWANWTATATATPAEAGKPVAILLTTTGIGQGDWDNVRMTGSAVPEPGTTLLLGLGLAGLVALWWCGKQGGRASDLRL
jgi:hypothetical protein